MSDCSSAHMLSLLPGVQPASRRAALKASIFAHTEKLEEDTQTCRPIHLSHPMISADSHRHVTTGLQEWKKAGYIKSVACPFKGNGPVCCPQGLPACRLPPAGKPFRGCGVCVSLWRSQSLCRMSVYLSIHAHLFSVTLIYLTVPGKRNAFK